jgi:hypothetical protein
MDGWMDAKLHAFFIFLQRKDFYINTSEFLENIYTTLASINMKK